MTTSATCQSSCGREDSRACSSSIFLQRSLCHQGMERELPALLVLGGGPSGMRLGEMIMSIPGGAAPVAELRLKVVSQLAGVLLGGGVKVRIGGAAAVESAASAALLECVAASSPATPFPPADASSSTGFCCNSCSTNTLSSSVGACSRASDCCSCSTGAGSWSGTTINLRLEA